MTQELIETKIGDLGITGSRAGGRLRVAQVVEQLSALCSAMSPGDRLPTHTELMRRLEMPERTVLSALKELYRLGIVERVQGSGTYVAERALPVTDNSNPLVRRANDKTIVALARPDHSYFDRSIQRLSKQASIASYDVIVRPVAEDRDLRTLADSLVSAGGFIVFGHFLAELGRYLSDRGERVVNIGTPIVGSYVTIPTVYSDQEAGGYLVASHLLNLGHRNIAFVHDDPEYLRETMRWTGHMRAIVEAQRSGAVVRSSIIDRATFKRLESSDAETISMFTGAGATTAVVAWNDVEAVRVFALFSRNAISVPGQVSLVGYDASEHGAIMYPSLTTVDNCLDQQIRAALDMLTNPAPPPSSYAVVMQPTLIARQSSGPPPFSLIR